MVDHPDHSPHPSSQRHHTHQHQHQHQHHRQQLSSSHQHQQAQQFKPHHHSSQTQRVYQNYSQEIQGPLSAGVIEGHRAFPSFHSSLHHHPRQPSASSSPSSTSYPNLSVADILDRYQDAHKDFLVSILNAKAKEDERKAEEERYKTEQIKLRSKQLDLELALEKRRGSPPAGRPYAINESESNTTSKRAHYSSTTPASVSAASYNNTGYQSYPPPSGSAQDGSRPQYGRHSHHDLMSNVQDNQEQPSPRDHASVKHGVTHPSYKEQAQAHMQPSPQGRPPSLKINTAVRQSYPKQQAGPNANKTPSSRHYALPGLSNSAQSSPVTNMDYQSYIPPPLTPKDDHVSPTSALSPAPGQTLKRKSIHHDAVMDAVRAKVLRNAGQSQQQREQQQQQHQHLHKKTSADFNARRKAYSQNSGSPERLKRAMEGFPTPRTAASPNSATTAVAPKLRNGSTTTTTGTTNTTSPSTRAVDLKQEGSRPLSHSPISPSSSPLANGDRGHSGSVRSGSMSPLPSLSGEEGPVSANGERVAAEGHSKSPMRQQISNDCAADEAEEKSSRYQLDRSRPERATDIGDTKLGIHSPSACPATCTLHPTSLSRYLSLSLSCLLHNMAPKKKSKQNPKGADVRPITSLSGTRSIHKQGRFTPTNNTNNDNDDEDSLKPKEKSEVELENLIFGDNEDLIGETLARAGHELSSDEEGDALDEFDYEAALGDDDEREGGQGAEGSDLFFIDEGPTPPVHRDEIDEDADMGSEGDDEHDGSDQESAEISDNETARLVLTYGGKPAWVDEDDKTLAISLKSVNRLKKLRKEENEDVVNGVDYEQRLRRQFEKVHPVPSWAQPAGSKKRRRTTALGAGSDSEYSDEEAEHEDNTISLLMNSKGYLESSTKLRILSSESLSVTRVKNANQMAYSKAVVQSVEFHPNSQMLLTAGFDRTLRLFQVDGKLNQLVQSVFYKDMPIYKAAFSATGKEVIASGRRKYFYSYDIEAGKVDKSHGIYGRQEKSLEKFALSPCGQWIAFLGRDGYIILVATNTRQWVKNLKMNGNVRAVAWSSDSNYLYSVGGDTEVYQWEVSSGKCLHRFLDEGGFKPTCIAVSPNDKFFAVGSKSGIVNVYDRTCLSSKNPKALRAIGNLTTSIHTMRFNHDSQILAISSKGRKDQLRLVHIPSLKVFPNWPTKGTPLSYVTCLSFSPRSGYLAIGNDKGNVLLYRLNHYPSA